MDVKVSIKNGGLHAVLDSSKSIWKKFKGLPEK